VEWAVNGGGMEMVERRRPKGMGWNWELSQIMQMHLAIGKHRYGPIQVKELFKCSLYRKIARKL